MHEVWTGFLYGFTHPIPVLRDELLRAARLVVVRLRALGVPLWRVA